MLFTIPNMKMQNRARAEISSGSDTDSETSSSGRFSLQDSATCDDDSPDKHNGSDSVKFRPYQAEKWQERFDELIEFRKQHKNCLVPHTYPANPELARWVKRQRYQYTLFNQNKKASINIDRIKILDDVGFVWDSHEATWQERLAALREFKHEHGHCEVPSKYQPNPQLATWVKCQRRQYKLFLEGQPSNITSERIAELESFGFKWEIRKAKPLKTRPSVTVNTQKSKTVDQTSKKRKFNTLSGENNEDITDGYSSKQRCGESLIGSDINVPQAQPASGSLQQDNHDDAQSEVVMKQLHLLTDKVSSLESVVTMQQDLINRMLREREKIPAASRVKNSVGDRTFPEASKSTKELETAAVLIEFNSLK
mmetsp:Transcript_2659/g.3932  ORF Transcript_2659/g.3932 Transcript_2659/m.3932 type:complete len:367 (+) Transcript_2659:92-1192(+)